MAYHSTREGRVFGIPVPYSHSYAALAAWGAPAGHLVGRARGRRLWYRHFEQRVARVERAYGGPQPSSSPASEAAP